MANLQERRNKDGKLISYSIRIFRRRAPDGKQLKPFTATFEVKPTWSEKSARKKAEAYAATLEKEVKEGRLENARQRFDQYCDYVLELKKRSGTKQTTLKGYRYLIPRSEEHTSELQSRFDLVCRHLLEKINDIFLDRFCVG